MRMIRKDKWKINKTPHKVQFLKSQPQPNPHLKPDKGHENGSCNRTACQAPNAMYYSHYTNKWYCYRCSLDIGEDAFNKNWWNENKLPTLGHPAFETREMMNARGAE